MCFSSILKVKRCLVFFNFSHLKNSLERTTLEVRKDQTGLLGGRRLVGVLLWWG